MLKEFRDFAVKGNVLDMTVGIIMGLAFGKITNSLVNDVIMPPIGLVLGRVDFNSLFVALNGAAYPSLDAARKAGAPVIAFGAFINTIIDFVIIAFVMFILVRQMNRLRPQAPVAKDCPFCASMIPLAALRCPNCTSQLAPPAAA